MENQIQISENSLGNLLSQEIALEKIYSPIILGLDVDLHMPVGITYRRFSGTYAKFRDEHPTPSLLAHLEPHARGFISFKEYEEDFAAGAVVWCVWKIFRKKLERREIFAPGLLEQAQETELRRNQRTETFKAISKIAKDCREDSFVNGMLVGMKYGQFESAGSVHHLMQTKMLDGGSDEN